MGKHHPVAGKQGGIAGLEYFDGGYQLRQRVKRDIGGHNPFELLRPAAFTVKGNGTG